MKTATLRKDNNLHKGGMLMFSEKKFFEYFPEAQQITDKELLKKCYEAFADAVERGGWTEETLDSCPSAVDEFVNSPATQMKHLQDGLRLSVMISDYLSDRYGEYISFNRDYVLAGALLHDLGKFTEYAVDEDGKPYVTENGKLLRHPLAGALIAERHGLPTEIVHLIATHSFEGEKSYKTVEHFIVKTSEGLAQKFLSFKFGADGFRPMNY